MPIGDTTHEPTDKYFVNLGRPENGDLRNPGPGPDQRHHLPPGPLGLTVSKGGPGGGVTGTGINCGTDCFESYCRARR